MTSLSLLCGEHYTDMKTLLTQIFDGSTIRAILVGHGFLFGHSLCCVEGSVGFTCSLEVTICYMKLMQSIVMLRINVVLSMINLNKAPVE